MRINSIHIQNFRSLADISITTDKPLNVIVGPNGIGKTSFLEAVRLAKAVLAPRYFEESTQVLQALGAVSQQMPFGVRSAFDHAALAGDVTAPLNIKLAVQLSDEEYQLLTGLKGDLASEILRRSMRLPDAQSRVALAQFLSSGQGVKQLQEVAQSVSTSLAALENQTLALNLTITPEGQLTGGDQLSHESISFLENRIPPNSALFTYFSADRAMPAGEVAIQLGTADMAIQTQSHIGAPQGKYTRLKQTILASLIGLGGDSAPIKKEFTTIFQNLLPGKGLDGITISQSGSVRVRIKDSLSGRVFDIDGLSSGEKGLILSFLIARNSLADGGILLFDEPELHLNQSVQRKILPFLRDHIVKHLSAQAFVCTHSPEIVAAAYGSEDCGLFHLRSGCDASRIYQRDQGEVFEVLNRLGSSTADVLFWKGTIGVEGDHDADLLEEGFFDIVAHFKITKLGGRQEVEKEIKRLKELEQQGRLQAVHGRRCFIFDGDNKTAVVPDSPFVRVLQWDRYCLENYLLNDAILYDALGEYAAAGVSLGSRGEFERAIKDLAMGQLITTVAREVYQQDEPKNAGWRPSDGATKNYEEIATVLSERLGAIESGLRSFEPGAWSREFVARCKQREAKLRPEWDQDWRTRCSGKQLFKDVQSRWQFRVNDLALKEAVMRKLRDQKAPQWDQMRCAIERLVG